MMAHAVSVDGSGTRWEVREVWFVGSKAVDDSRPLDLMNEYLDLMSELMNELDSGFFCLLFSHQ